MKISELDEAIYNRYIAPSRRPRSKKAGLEFELPIVNTAEKAVDFSVVHRAAELFAAEFGFTGISRDDDGYIYNAADHLTGDILSFDCSYNTLELSFGAEENIHDVDARFRKYYSFLKYELEKDGHTLTGMGINPNYKVNNNVPVKSERYRMLLHHLSSYKKYGNSVPFHDHPNFGLFSCASQVQLDVEEEYLAETLNTFNRLEPLKAIMFANSIWNEDGADLLCSRDYFWRNSLHGLNPHNVDMFGVEFESADEIIAYIRSMSMYCVQREGKYINFVPTPLTEYFSADSIKGEYFDGISYKQIDFRPELTDLEDLRSFKFEDVTFRGTVEFRSVCEQPVSEIFAAGAFHAGLLENLGELTDLLKDDHVIYHKGYNAEELRRIFTGRKIPGIFDRDEISKLLLRILGIAEDGLEQRGFGEETYLEPLYPRAEKLMSPAAEMLIGLKNGKATEEYISEYGRL